MRILRKFSRRKETIFTEIFRKTVHAFIGVFIILLVQGGILDAPLLGLYTLLFAAVVLYNYQYERELILRILSIHRADAKIPGLDLLAYFAGAWLSLVFFEQTIAFAAILILAFGDPLAHLVSRGFGGANVMVSRDSYWYGYVAGTLGATIAAMAFIPFINALIASAIAMFVEAGEFKIADHYIDDNLTIPLVAGAVLTVIQYVV